MLCSLSGVAPGLGGGGVGTETGSSGAGGQAVLPWGPQFFLETLCFSTQYFE